MKLKDKFDNPIMRHDLGRNEIEETKEQCVEIAEEFAIDFAEWLENGKFSQYGNSWIDPRKHKDKDGNWLFFTSKKLLEIYKKETL